MLGEPAFATKLVPRCEFRWERGSAGVPSRRRCPYARHPTLTYLSPGISNSAEAVRPTHSTRWPTSKHPPAINVAVVA